MLRRVEVHITYRCNLTCLYCNRGCFSHLDFAPDMTLDQFASFFEECKLLHFPLDDIIIIGGEPTLHPQCVDFCRMARDANNGRVILFSNNYSDESHKMIDYIWNNIDGVWVDKATFKTTGSWIHVKDDEYVVYVSPDDINKDRTEECGAYTSCGFSLDSLGYTACSLGGMIASVLCPGIRTKNLYDLLDKDFVEWQLGHLCKNCGALLCRRSEAKELFTYKGTQMTRTWYNAFQKFEGEKSGI